MAIWIALFALLAVVTLWVVVTGLLLRAAIGLAFASVLLAVLLFFIGAPLAAVFELSVCAGLIPVLFVSMISMTRRGGAEDRKAMRRIMLKRTWPLPLLLALVGVALSFVHGPVALAIPGVVHAENAQSYMWNVRRMDLFGQVLILLAGVYAVVVLFREGQKP